MEKFCPACSRVYGEDAEKCELDGERLVLLSEEPSLVGHVLDSKYTLISKLGEGGMGSVYLAEQATMGREVAIKVLRREFSQNRQAIKRFLREARAASKLAHPNTITVYDFGQSNDGLLYLVMERLSGRPLADILDADGALAVDRTVHIVSQICDSLAEAHRQGITHRDLKPENIFIEQKVGNPYFVKVLDFGIAKMAGDEATTQATATGMICGTPSYMSPEQAMGKEIDGRSDIYALGVLTYEMLTNDKPFTGDTPMEVMLKHINEPSPNIYQRTQIQVPQGIQDALDRMLAKKVDQRPTTCEEAKSLLQSGLGTALVGPIVSTNDPSLPKKRRDDTAERMASSEKTGLAPAVVPPALVEAPKVEARASRRWLWAAVFLIGAVGAAVAIAMGTGGDSAAKGRGEKIEVADPTPKPDPKGTDPAKAGPDKVAAANGVQDPNAGKKEGPATKPAPNDPTPVAVKAGVVAGEATKVAGDKALTMPAAVAPVAVDTPAVTPEVAKIKITVRSNPVGAQVFEGETLLGKTPLTFERQKDSGVVKLNLVLKGYQPRPLSRGTVSDYDEESVLKKAGGGASGNTSGTIKNGGGSGTLGGTF